MDGTGGYSRHSRYRLQHHHQQQTLYQRSTFLPLLCRLSIKDVKMQQSYNDHSSRDPSSPRVSCMGQVKRNNKVTGFPPPAAAGGGCRLINNPATVVSNGSPGGYFKYTKLKKLLSSKNLTTPSTTDYAAVSAGGGSKSCRSEMSFRDSKCRRSCSSSSVVVDVTEMDPPLPVPPSVIKKPPAAGGCGGRDEVNLWKRRCSGITIKSLQIQQKHHHLMNNTDFHPPPTV